MPSHAPRSVPRAVALVVAMLLGACGDGAALDLSAANAPAPPSAPATCDPARAREGARTITPPLAVWNLGVAVDGGDVYFRTFDPHTVWRVHEGGAPTKVWSGQVGIFGAGMAVADGFAYWTGLAADHATLEAIFRAPVRGGAALVVGYLPSPCAAYGGFAVDASNAYAATIACSIGRATVARVPLGGGGAETLWSDAQWTVGGLALTRDAVAITASSADGDADGDDRAAEGQVLLVPKAGGPASVVAHIRYAGPIAADDDTLYFVDDDTLYALSADGSGAPTALAGGVRGASSVATDGRGVYVGIGGTRSRALHDARVVFVAKGGGPAVTLASRVDQLGTLSTDGRAVYWSTLGSPDTDSGGAVYKIDVCP